MPHAAAAAPSGRQQVLGDIAAGKGHTRWQTNWLSSKMPYKALKQQCVVDFEMSDVVINICSH